MDQNQSVGTLTEGDDSGFCKSMTSSLMTSSASSLAMTRPIPKLPSKGLFTINYLVYDHKINSNKSYESF